MHVICRAQILPISSIRVAEVDAARGHKDLLISSHPSPLPQRSVVS